MSSKLYINKENLKNNLEYIHKFLNPKTRIIAMVKANAYGCGMIEITKYLETLGVTDYGVALVKEGVFLRQNGILSNILVTSQFITEDINDIIKYNLSVSVSNIELLEKLNNEAEKHSKLIKIHIKIDTGMGRLGFTEDNIYDNIQIIKNNFNNIIIDGIYTHLSCADSDENYTLKQLEKFDNILNKLQNLGFKFNYIHALNSYGILRYNKYQFTHVRPGMLLYGYLEENCNGNIKSILTLKSPVLRIQEFNNDSKISYNGSYTAKKGSKIATIGIGYADGLPRNVSNNYYVHIGNEKAKIVGNICMDMCMLDITNIKSKINVGDFVTVIRDSEDVEKISKLSNTISYEIISKLSPRIDRYLI